MHRALAGLLVLLGLGLSLSPPASADDAAKARELLVAIEQGKGDRAALTQELAAVAPRAIAAIGAYLARPHQTDVDTRREVLAAIGADVPDKDGKFKTPDRMKPAAVKADDELDWLTPLTKLDPATPGLGEVIADVAGLRALAATRRVDAAQVILDVGFAEATMIYRDECGRRLRQMAPYSLPALTAASQATSKANARYATYQLERMDRQEPGKAVSATAADEDLRIELLDAFGRSHHREAVGVVLRMVNDDAGRVRAAARAAWLEYVTGKPPKPAPKKRLQLPGGKLAEKETPLWLTHRELAEIELKRVAEETLGETFTDNQKVDLGALSKKLFDHYDGKRRERDDAFFGEAKAKADAGDLPGAAAGFDRLLAENPELPQRADTAPVYLALGKALEQAGTWDGAAAAYGKAFGVAPEGPHAVDAQAGREYALGKALEAAGKDGSANFRRAVALKPDYAPARAAAAKDAPPTKKPWLLYTAIAGGLLALGFLGAGLVLRKR
ncbi:MAG TPA: hypothetical protein VM734_08780 [Kofleriaceae bacterium]|nr:hypothetical protein [Kofleriaceae bacterium]